MGNEQHGQTQTACMKAMAWQRRHLWSSHSISTHKGTEKKRNGKKKKTKSHHIKSRSIFISNDNLG